jgi:hypothetical protein
MSYEFIGIFDFGSIANDTELNHTALNDSVLNIPALNNASKAASIPSIRPLARTPDTPSSTR